MNVQRTPLFFGREDHSRFGWIHTPAGGAQGDLAIVICPPFGHEYVSSHRSVRHLADALARSGVPAMRFDYDGTGDSAGGDEDENRVQAWRESIRDAMQTIRETTGCRRVGLTGVRLGALLAATIAAETEVACLVLWAPLTRGRQYLRELKALALVGGAPEAATFEPGGFLITEATQHDIESLDLGALALKTEHVLKFPGDPDMFLPPHAATVPHDAIAQIVAWVGERAGGAQRLKGSEAQRLRGEQFLADIRETIVQFTNVFGIISEPLHPATDAPMVLLSNAGSTHHAGPNRLYVFLARALSRAGFRVLRFDLPGLGDSVIDDVTIENDPYPSTASSVIADAMAAMQQERDAHSFVVAGLCSGAHAAFHAVLDRGDAPIVESVLINPLTFYYQRGMSLDQPLGHYDEWQWYMRSIRSRDRWLKLLRGQVNLLDVARVAWQRLRESLAKKPDTLARDLRRFAELRRKVTFVFSRFDPGHDLLMAGAAKAVKRLRKNGTLALWRIDDADHTFEARHSRNVMIASLVEHLAKRYMGR
jgi:pimeloyl-ACP methyl ester carboxylesterase